MPSSSRWKAVSYPHLDVYKRQGQRSLADRLIFGARGGYRFGGRLRSDFNLTEEELGLRRYLMGKIFPQLRNVRFSHSWGGNLGMARRFQPHMLRDSRNRIALSGGYGGEAVSYTHLDVYKRQPSAWSSCRKMVWTVCSAN